jgi:copper(I)-binding protein
MTRLRIAAFAALLLVSAPAFAHEGVIHTGCPTGQSFTVGGLTVTGAFIRATPKAAQSAGAYLSVSNTGPDADTLTGASSEAAGDIALHLMKMNGNVMEMSSVEGGLAIPPGGSASLDPMGYHLMLTGMGQQFVEGQCVEMTLHFAKAGDLPIELNVGSFAQSAPPASSGVSVMSSGAMDMSSMSMPM